MKLQVRTADRVHKGELDLDPGSERVTRVSELMDLLRGEFKLPATTEFFLRSERLGRQLDAGSTLHDVGIADGDTLEVAPLLQAGHE